MKRNDLDHAFDPTPHIFTDRVDAVLQTIKEDEPVKKFTLRTIMAALLCTMLFCSIACAIVFTQGQEWYYNNRFTAYQKNEPEKQQAIFEHLETDVQQEPSEDSNGLVDVTIQDYSWVPSQNLFTISFAARARDNGSYELHSMTDMDADGHWAPTLDPKDEESRTEHWLSTEKGFGLPAEVMDDPAKKLLLTDLGSNHIFIGDSNVDLKTWCFDGFTGEDGSVIAVMEIDLMPSDGNSLEKNADTAVSVTSADATYLHLGDSGDAVIKLQEALVEQGYYQSKIDGLYGESVRSAVKKFQEANKLFSDGVAGPATQTKIYGEKETPEDSKASVDGAYFQPGDTGDAVVNLQQRLTELGYFHGSNDGIYSEDVSLAVIAFQEANELVSDGVVGPATDSKLYSYYAKVAPKNNGIGDEAQTTDIPRTQLEKEYDNAAADQEELFSAMLVDETIAKYTDAEGMLSLRLPYQIIPFENGKYGSPAVGTVVFKVKIR